MLNTCTEDPNGELIYTPILDGQGLSQTVMRQLAIDIEEHRQAGHRPWIGCGGGWRGSSLAHLCEQKT